MSWCGLSSENLQGFVYLSKFFKNLLIISSAIAQGMWLRFHWLKMNYLAIVIHCQDINFVVGKLIPAVILL
jgi:hypothetical protein